MKDPAGGRRLKAMVDRARLPLSEMTNEQMAKRLGVTRAGMLTWFAGQEPSLASITAIASFVGCERWRVLATFDGDGPQ